MVYIKQLYFGAFPASNPSPFQAQKKLNLRKRPTPPLANHINSLSLPSKENCHRRRHLLLPVVLLQLQKLKDISVPWLQIDGQGALALASALRWGAFHGSKKTALNKPQSALEKLFMTYQKPGKKLDFLEF